MRPVIGWPIAVMLSLMSVIAFVNGEALNEWVRDHAININSNEQAPLVGITDEEVWFVVLVDFPDQEESENCDQRRASNLIDDSAEKHLKQGFGPQLTLQIDYHDRIVTTDFGMEDYGHDANGEMMLGAMV